MNAKRFSRQLLETISWCEARADVFKPKLSLRSNELRPDVEFYELNDPTFWNSAETIESVVTKRSSLIYPSESANAELPKTYADLRGGRLLLCYFDETNHNYGSAEETAWFFDGYDNPPWDTWIACVNNCLVSWVPKEFILLASEGIAVECCDMLFWLEQSFSRRQPYLTRCPEDWLRVFAPPECS